MSETTEASQTDDPIDETTEAAQDDQTNVTPDEIGAAVETQTAQGTAEGEGEETEKVAWEESIEELEKQQQMGNEAGENEASFEAFGTSSELEAGESEAGLHLQTPNLRFILDIPLQMTVELGRKRLLIQDLLQLNHGSVLELTKQVGDSFEVFVNQKLIARGEVVVVNEKFGVRITDILSPTKRVQQLQ